MQPKVPSVTKVVSVTFGIFVTLASALWFLSAKLSDRPTTEQFFEVMESHEKRGHPATREKISEIREDLAAQGQLIQDVRHDQGEANRKLDTLLIRLAPKTKRHR